MNLSNLTPRQEMALVVILILIGILASVGSTDPTLSHF